MRETERGSSSSVTFIARRETGVMGVAGGAVEEEEEEEEVEEEEDDGEEAALCECGVSMEMVRLHRGSSAARLAVARAMASSKTTDETRPSGEETLMSQSGMVGKGRLQTCRRGSD